MHETTVSLYVNGGLFIFSTVYLSVSGDSFLFFMDFTWHSAVMMAMLGILVILVQTYKFKALILAETSQLQVYGFLPVVY